MFSIKDALALGRHLAVSAVLIVIIWAPSI